MIAYNAILRHCALWIHNSTRIELNLQLPSMTYPRDQTLAMAD